MPTNIRVGWKGPLVRNTVANYEHLVKERLSTVDLLALTSLDQLIFILKIVLTFVAKHATSIRRFLGLCFPVQLVFPVFGRFKLLRLYL